ncbi:MAG TPA: exonuclease domain-containing protein [Symbiobacteriaceae bacterium]|nr:exonuclease domain-containing protein [Symbiobacteriaceae bacterium]
MKEQTIGFYNGRYYTDYLPEVDELRRTGRLGDAERLILDLLNVGEEKEAIRRDGVSPELYYRLAVIYRKQNRTDDEIALLKRFVAHRPRPVQRTHQLLERLQKLMGTEVAASTQSAEVIPGLQTIDRATVTANPERVVIAGYVDVETTGLSPYYDEIIELALVLFAFDVATGEVLGVVDFYVGLREPGRPISEGAYRVHRISKEMVRGHQLDHQRASGLIDQAAFLVAHNASFDRGFLERLFPQVQAKTWFCSMNGINWARHGHQSKALQRLVAEHGIPVTHAHRSEADVMAALRLLSYRTGRGTYLSEMIGGWRPGAQPPGPIQAGPTWREVLTTPTESSATRSESKLGCLVTILGIVVALALIV